MADDITKKKIEIAEKNSHNCHKPSPNVVNVVNTHETSNNIANPEIQDLEAKENAGFFQGQSETHEVQVMVTNSLDQLKENDALVKDFIYKNPLFGINKVYVY